MTNHVYNSIYHAATKHLVSNRKGEFQRIREQWLEDNPFKEGTTWRKDTWKVKADNYARKMLRIKYRDEFLKLLTYYKR